MNCNLHFNFLQLDKDIGNEKMEKNDINKERCKQEST